ncbi:hypothetical protein K438DRAFT_1038655 [Mycena galopus ATCC 62051]|nr:hypothetical protein K438DRAFT_1038655 [Mycena galopus ATCC 62051]
MYLEFPKYSLGHLTQFCSAKAPLGCHVTHARAPSPARHWHHLRCVGPLHMRSAQHPTMPLLFAHLRTAQCGQRLRGISQVDPQGPCISRSALPRCGHSPQYPSQSGGVASELDGRYRSPAAQNLRVPLAQRWPHAHIVAIPRPPSPSKRPTPIVPYPEGGRRECAGCTGDASPQPLGTCHAPRSSSIAARASIVAVPQFSTPSPSL